MVAKSIRKSVSFDDSDGDRALLDVIATHQSEQQQTFSELCKQALRQYLLNQEPTQSVMLFMELQHQIAQLGARVATLEARGSLSTDFEQPDGETPEMPHATAEEDDIDEPAAIDDPVLSRLGPLLDDF